MGETVLYPVARAADGTIAWAESCARGDFACLECGGQVFLHRGSQLQAHFHHAADEPCLGSAESALHLAAKEVLVQAVTHWTDRPITVRRACPRCNAGVRFPALLPPFPSAQVEYMVKTGSRSVRVDVGVLDAKGAPAWLVEVRVKHPVPPEKADALNQSKIFWIEVPGRTTVASGGTSWAMLAGRVRPRLCNTCEAAEASRFANGCKHEELLKHPNTRPAWLRECAVEHKWSCTRCGEVHFVARNSCAICGSFAPRAVGDMATKAFLKWEAE